MNSLTRGWVDLVFECVFQHCDTFKTLYACSAKGDRSTTYSGLSKSALARPPQEMIKKAFGGILLVDEAYYLYNAANDKDYGQESIEILLNVMEEQKDDLIVTLAGCAELIFCARNSGFGLIRG